jgi:hypothetical protein
MTYKQLEGVEVQNEGWTGAAEARETITAALALYHATFSGAGL